MKQGDLNTDLEFVAQHEDEMTTPDMEIVIRLLAEWCLRELENQPVDSTRNLEQ